MIHDMVGGGTALNFKIRGGTEQPIGPKENTIWVNTDKDIPGWYFTTEQPFMNNVEMIETAGEYLLYLNMLTTLVVKKENAGKAAYVAVGLMLDEKKYAGIMLLSPHKDACTMKLSYGGIVTTIEAENTIMYGGQTYYYSYLFDTTYINYANFPYCSAKSHEELAEMLAPAYDCTGRVWFKNDTNGKLSFDALRKNMIQVHLVEARQYINGSWETVETKIYQNGAWNDLFVWNGELYGAGDEYTSVTGGWQARALDYSNSGNYVEGLPTVTKHNDRIQFVFDKPGKCACGGIEIANDIDLTDWKTITLEFSGSAANAALTLAVIDRSIALYQGNTKAQEQLLATGTSADKKTVTLDISSVSGKYDIILYARLTLGTGSVDASMYSMKLSV